MKKVKKKIRKIRKKLKEIKKQNYYIKQYYNAKIDDYKILVESKNGADIASNMFYILKELSKKEYQEYKVYLSMNKDKMSDAKKLLQHYQINNVNIVERMSMEYLSLLATAKYLFNDTSFFSGFIKKEEQIYTNTWHGTPLKYMSNDVPTRRYAMGNVKRNFLMCDYLVYPNDEMEEKMVSAYSIRELYKGKVLSAGYPRNAIFFDEKRRQQLKKELKLDKKEVIVYMPTWRGEMHNKKINDQLKNIMDSMMVIDDLLTDNQVFYVKLHVLVQQELNFSGFKHIKTFPVEYETYDFLNIADCLVTDYSSVFFDFANTGRKIILYTYDKEDYLSYRGVYYDLDSLPFPKVMTAKEVVEEINRKKSYDDKNFKKKFCTYDNKNATQSLVEFVIKNKKSSNVKVKKLKKNNKDNVLIYSGSLAFNGFSSALISLLNIIDLQRENIFISFREKSIAHDPLRLERLPEKVNIFPIINGFWYMKKELIAYILYYKFNINISWVRKILDKFYEREIKRFFGNAKIDRVIQFTGYEKRIVGLFQRFKVPKAIFVHSNMLKEIKSKKNHHLLTLRSAYQNYDKVVSVTEDTVSSIIEISGKKDNICIINNAHDYKSIMDKKEQEIRYDEKTKSNVKENVLRELLEKKDTIKFINIGRFSPEKGHKRLIDAFNKFYQKYQNSYLYIIGGYGKDYDTIKEYIKTLSCKYNVILINNISNPFPILKRCDLFILSSFYEALGLVLLEAETCGVKVISTDIDGPKIFMQEHGGYLVENSEEGILQGMYDFMDGKIKRLKFDPEKYNQQIKQQYEHLFDDREERK